MAESTGWPKQAHIEKMEDQQQLLEEYAEYREEFMEFIRRKHKRELKDEWNEDLREEAEWIKEVEERVEGHMMLLRQADPNLFSGNAEEDDKLDQVVHTLCKVHYDLLGALIRLQLDKYPVLLCLDVDRRYFDEKKPERRHWDGSVVLLATLVFDVDNHQYHWRNHASALVRVDETPFDRMATEFKIEAEDVPRKLEEILKVEVEEEMQAFISETPNWSKDNFSFLVDPNVSLPPA